MLLTKTNEDNLAAKGNITLLKRQVMREHGILGGREMLKSIMNSFGPLERRNCMRELNASRVCVAGSKRQNVGTVLNRLEGNHDLC